MSFCTFYHKDNYFVKLLLKSLQMLYSLHYLFYTSRSYNSIFLQFHCEKMIVVLIRSRCKKLIL
jgi:hypothetical protein